MSTLRTNSNLWRLSFAMFFAYMTIGLPLTVIPLYVHQLQGMNDTVVGMVMGSQFLATLVTRSYAGRRVDQYGAKRTTLQGLFTCSLSGLIWLLVTSVPADSWLLLPLLLLARLLLGIGESQIVTGNLSWAIALMGSMETGRVMSWNGIATYGALAAGAPLGLLIMQTLGIKVAAACAAVLPVLALAMNATVPAVPAHGGQRLPLSGVLKMIWQAGLGLALQGVGFAVLGAFVSLYFDQRHWGNAGLALTAFGLAFIAMRLLFSGLADRYGGRRIASLLLLVECGGLLTLSLAPNVMVALIGAALTGAGCSLIFPALGVIVVRLVPARVRGTALAGYSAFQDLSYGITGPITGLLAGMYGYPAVFFAAACCALSGAALVYLLLPAHVSVKQRLSGDGGC